MSRTQFLDAGASLWLQGGLVPLEELVLQDAAMDQRGICCKGRLLEVESKNGSKDFKRPQARKLTLQQIRHHRPREGIVREFVNTFLLVFAGLFPIINPLGNAPIFLSLTRQCTDQERHMLAWRVAVNGFLLLLGSLLIGSHILTFFGLTLPTIRIAGGLIIASVGWKLLASENDQQDRRTASAPPEHVAPLDSFYPLTMPLTVGPGSIAVAVTLGSRRPAVSESISHLALLAGAAFLGLIASAATIYLSYRFAANITSILGKGGTNVLLRLSAFILVCIGIEIIWTGYSALLATVGH